MHTLTGELRTTPDNWADGT